jgi:hypothetical protein
MKEKVIDPNYKIVEKILRDNAEQGNLLISYKSFKK